MSACITIIGCIMYTCAHTHIYTCTPFDSNSSLLHGGWIHIIEQTSIKLYVKKPPKNKNVFIQWAGPTGSEMDLHTWELTACLLHLCYYHICAAQEQISAVTEVATEYVIGKGLFFHPCYTTRSFYSPHWRPNMPPNAHTPRMSRALQMAHWQSAIISSDAKLICTCSCD